jgi:hypothetical protein
MNVKKKKKNNGIKLDAYNIIKMICHGFQCDKFSLSQSKDSVARKLFNRVQIDFEGDDDSGIYAVVTVKSLFMKTAGNDRLPFTRKWNRI